MKYVILSEDSPKELEEKVNKHLKKGYILVGGVSHDWDRREYLQAMIKQSK